MYIPIPIILFVVGFLVIDYFKKSHQTDDSEYYRTLLEDNDIEY